MGLFRELFAWWTGNTIGTRLYTARRGRLVGEDAYGNRYYEQRRGNGPLGRPRRWVIYTDLAEATRVPPDWHGWLHHTHAAPPDDRKVQPRHWEREHRPNMTGTPAAYRPEGSILSSAKRPPATGDYEAWRPKH